MNKIRFLLVLFNVAFFFFIGNFKVDALESVSISEAPVASDILYGEPLFQSELIGGQASVEGEFKWVNETVVRPIGLYTEDVIFIPYDEKYESQIISVDVMVNPKKVYITFERDLQKKYDGNDSLKLPGYVIHGIIDKDVYVRGNLVGTLTNVFVGENIDVNLSGLELVGEKKVNYYLDLSGFKAVVHPHRLEMFGNYSSLDFYDDVYVGAYSSFYVSKYSESVETKGYSTKHVYDIYVLNKNKRIDVNGDIKVKIKIDYDEIDYKRVKLFNYYDNEFEEINYVYEDGYLIYNCHGLGKLVISEKMIDYSWLYIILGSAFFISASVVIIKYFGKKEKINKYKSLKRRKDDGDNL